MISYELRITGKEPRKFNTLQNAQKAAEQEKEYKIYKVELVEEVKENIWEDVKKDLSRMDEKTIKSVADSVKPKNWN